MALQIPLDILVGRALGRAHIVPTDLAPAALGCMAFGPAALLADLELRLGLPAPPDAPLARLDAFRAELSERSGIFAASLAIDPWGTARTALAMRDELVEAGWQGDLITTAGPRIAGLTSISIALPPGRPERLLAVLAALRFAPYTRLTLAEPASLWPALWRRLFERLAALGTMLDTPPPPAPADRPTSDLAALQRLLADPAAPPPRLTGDGSLVLLAAETPEPLAEAVAVMLSREPPTAAVLRTGDHAPLEAALARHGLPRLGGLAARQTPCAAAWLPLVLRLARAPFDPESALDLVLMSGHGLSRYHTDRIAAALADSPGLASRALGRVTADAEAAHPDAFARLFAWLTPEPGGPDDALSVEALARRLAPLDALLRARRGAAHADPDSDLALDALADDALARARHTVGAVLRALPPTGALDAAPLDALITLLSRDAVSATTRLEAGDLLRADAPDALLAPVDTLLWWGFADPIRPPRSFRPAELAALAGLGLAPPDPRAELHAEAIAARAAFQRATRRLVLAAPTHVGGEAQAPHPLWSELAGRLALPPTELHRLLVRTPAELVRALAFARAPVPRRALPPRTPTWRAPPTALTAGRPLSTSRLQRLLDCPLAHVLDVHARLHRRATGRFDTGPKLLGRVGHLLVERLHLAGLLARAAPDDVRATLAAVLGDEASHLLRPGRAFERRHCEALYLGAVSRLARELGARGLTVVAVEEEAEVTLGGESVSVRTDIRAVDAAGRMAILDLKWSTRSHAHALQAGRAIQLATYVVAFPPDTSGHYFGFMRADLVSAGADALAETRRRIVQNLEALRRELGLGVVPVSGLTEAPPLGEALGLPSSDSLAEPAAPCRYCDYGALCGHAWRATREEWP